MRNSVITTFSAGVLLLITTSCTTGEAPDTPATVALPSVTASVEPSEEPEVPDLTEETCGDILTALAGAREAVSTAVQDITAAPAAFSQVAANLRAAAAEAGAELSASTEELAAAFDDLASRIRSGDVFNLDFQALDAPLSRLFTLCGG